MAQDKSKGAKWDLTPYFPEFNGPEMTAFKKKLTADIAVLLSEVSQLGDLSPDTADGWEKALLHSEEINSLFGHLSSYIGCLTAAYADNEEYASEEASLSKLSAEYEKVFIEVMRAIKPVSDKFFAEFCSRKSLEGAQNMLNRVREEAKFTMSPELERLSSDLNVDGFHSWGRLYDTLTGKLEFDMAFPDGRVERLPIAQCRSLMADADREIGKAAFEGGNKAWQSIETVTASALNAIAGTRLTLNKYRGVGNFLDKALFQAAISRETLDAMYAAIKQHIDIPRAILKAKAKKLGREGIWWFEREAPLPLKDSSRYTWEQGKDMVGRAFRSVYPALADFYDDAVEKRWVESEARAGKRPGAFCTGSSHIKQSRVFMTFNGALGDVSTLAHEMGHAFHGHILKDFRPFAQEYPMTLAETASIFAEQILSEGLYSNPDITDEQKLLILDAELCDAAIMLLDITVRFEFEKKFYEERSKGELSVSRFKELMVEMQRDVLGDCLLEDGVDPYFWASKLHFYITYVTFYNFPYTFGFLLARTLFTLFSKEGPSFLPKYEEFLRLTGSDTVENVARRSIGADTTDPAFWAEAITSLSEPLERYRRL